MKEIKKVRRYLQNTFDLANPHREGFEHGLLKIPRFEYVKGKIQVTHYVDIDKMSEQARQKFGDRKGGLMAPLAKEIKKSTGVNVLCKRHIHNLEEKKKFSIPEDRAIYIIRQSFDPKGLLDLPVKVGDYEYTVKTALEAMDQWDADAQAHANRKGEVPVEALQARAVLEKAVHETLLKHWQETKNT